MAAPEFVLAARERLDASRFTVAAGYPTQAASLGYHSILYSARAALLQEGKATRTHTGAWTLFREQFVTTGRIDEDVFQLAQRARRARSEADDHAGVVTTEEAAQIVATAEAFLAWVEELYPDRATTPTSPRRRRRSSR